MRWSEGLLLLGIIIYLGYKMSLSRVFITQTLKVAEKSLIPRKKKKSHLFKFPMFHKVLSQVVLSGGV